MKAVIVEDELIVADHLALLLEKQGVTVVDFAKNVSQAIQTLDLFPDFYLLDIRLAHGSNGIDFGAILKKKGIPFTYISANSEPEVMSKAIETNPQHYLTKPFKDKDVVVVIELMKAKLKDKFFIEIQSTKGKERWTYEELLYCKGDNVYVHFFSDTRKALGRYTLNQISETLPENFVRLHRSYLVNKNKILTVKTNSVVLEGKIEIPVSRTYKALLENL
jgi:two-component system response regulator LytT